MILDVHAQCFAYLGFGVNFVFIFRFLINFTALTSLQIHAYTSTTL